jgi:hypothetical protein
MQDEDQLQLQIQLQIRCHAQMQRTRRAMPGGLFYFVPVTALAATGNKFLVLLPAL